MIKYQRTKNSLRNTAFGLILKIINMFGAFAARTMLIHILGVEYVGLDGLFVSVLTMLNMAELGFSSAVVFKLYEPIAAGDTDTVCALMNYYKKIYRYIGIFVAIAGVVMVPFLRFFVKGGAPDNVNIYLLYAIYLSNTVLSYWLFAYKTALLNAHQRNDLASKVNSIAFLLKYLIQFIVLLSTRNYYCYAIIIPLTTLLTNLGSALIANKYYPQYVCRGELKNEDREEIKEKVTALVYNKVGVAIINGSDNIVISSFLGLTLLGIYDSYYYIFNMLHSFFDVFHNAITAGIGNSIVTESVDNNYKLFDRLNFMNMWLVGWCSICMCCLYQPFITLWVGQEKALTNWFSLLMAVYFYFWMVRFITLIFKNAQGLWRQDRFRSISEGVFNLCLNLIMVQFIGIYGITLSTIIAMLVISVPWETGVLFKHYFNRSPKEYYFTLIGKTVVTACVGAATYLICSLFSGGLIMTLLFRAIVCIMVPNVVFVALYHKSEHFSYMLKMIGRFIKPLARKAGI